MIRAQAKSISSFAANPLRARIMIRELERKCLEVKPLEARERFDRFEHINQIIECHQKSFALPRRPFFRWRNGEALPNLTTRQLIDNLFSEQLGSKWGGRGIDDPEQTLLVALDLISRSNTPNNHETLAEAEAILRTVSAAVRDLIPKIPNLNKPKFSSYVGGKSLDSDTPSKSSRYSKLSNKRPVAYTVIAERLNPYDIISPLCAALMYLIKPNSMTNLSDDLARVLLLDFISGVIAAYVVMLHRNPAEFKAGGLVVDLYRLVYRLFLCSDSEWGLKKSELIKEVFNNRFSDFSIESDSLILGVSRLIGLSHRFIEKAGLSSVEFFELIEPVDPDSTHSILSWWK